jgi:hypothetical protein
MIKASFDLVEDRTLLKELIESGPLGPRSDITSKNGFLLVLVNVSEAKKVSAT